MFISLSYLLSIIFLFADHDFIIFLQDIKPAPLARTISYNISGPISALGFQSPNLAQLMSRYATLDPILTSSASDKRKPPTLIAPPTAKKKEQAKKCPFRLECLALLSTMSSFSLTIYLLHDFRLEHNNQWLSQLLPILHQLVRLSPSHLPFILSSAFVLDWLIAEEVLTDQAMGSSAPTQDPIPGSPRAQPASPQLEVSVSPDHPASPQPSIQELSAEPEKSPSPTREARNDVSVKIHPFIFNQ
jgi:hypothetical protein